MALHEPWAAFPHLDHLMDGGGTAHSTGTLARWRTVVRQYDNRAAGILPGRHRAEERE